MLRAFVIVLLSVVPAVAADEAFKLKLYQPKTGDKFEVEKIEERRNDVTVDIGGNVRNQTVTTAKKEVYTDEILEKGADDKKPSKLKRTYSVAEKTSAGKTAKTVYDGKTVVIEKKGNKYEFNIDGKAIAEEDAPELFASFRKEDEPNTQDLLPTEAVKAGDTWKVPAEKAERFINAGATEEKTKIDVKNSSISGKLVKTYKKDGAQFGVIEMTITVAFTEVDLGGGMGAATKAGSKSVMVATIDTCIDGTVNADKSKLALTMEITAELPNNGTLTVKSKTTGSETTKPVKK
jgi:hypothetical protein